MNDPHKRRRHMLTPQQTAGVILLALAGITWVIVVALIMQLAEAIGSFLRVVMDLAKSAG